MVRVMDLSDKKVITSDGIVVGKVADFDLDPTGWRAISVFVNLSDSAARLMGTTTSFWTSTLICLPISYISQIGDVITLNMKASELKTNAVCPQPTSQQPTMTTI